MTEFCRILWEVDLQRTVWALPFPMTGRSSVVLGLCNEKPESLSLKYGGEETLTCTGQVKRRSTKVQSCVGCHAMWRNVYRVTVIRSIYLPLTFTRRSVQLPRRGQRGDSLRMQSPLIVPRRYGQRNGVRNNERGLYSYRGYSANVWVGVCRWDTDTLLVPFTL